MRRGSDDIVLQIQKSYRVARSLMCEMVAVALSDFDWLCLGKMLVSHPQSNALSPTLSCQPAIWVSSGFSARFAFHLNDSTRSFDARIHGQHLAQRPIQTAFCFATTVIMGAAAPAMSAPSDALPTSSGHLKPHRHTHYRPSGGLFVKQAFVLMMFMFLHHDQAMPPSSSHSF